MKTQGSNTMFIKNTAGRVIGKFSFERIEAVARALFYNDNVKESAKVDYSTIAVTMKQSDVHSFKLYLKQFDVNPCDKYLQR